MSKVPSAWLIPELFTFEGVEYTSCPVSQQQFFEGTVAWRASIFCDSQDKGVTDKFGVTHFPKPLVVNEDVKLMIPRTKQEVLDYLRVAKMHVEHLNSILQEVLDSKPGSES